MGKLPTKFATWLNISIDEETLRKVKDFAERRQASALPGTIISLSAAARMAMIEGIRAIEALEESGE